MTFIKTVVQIRDLLESIIQDSSCEAKAKGVDIRLELGDSIPDAFETDKTKLNQILGTLLQQAIARTDGGSVTLSVQAAADQKAGGIKFQLKDTGIPVEDGKIRLVLDSSVSAAHWKQDDVYSRIALPLRMSGRLISVLGGQLELEGSSEEETCFAFTLPAKSVTEQAPVKSASPPSAADRSSEKVAVILLVDDVTENRTLLEVLLKKMGNTCEHSIHGQDAVEECKARKYDLILMDLQMPVMNGFDAIRAIRKGGLNTATPIVAMTASGQKGDDLMALDAGCSDCLGKPVDRRKLERKVWRLLSQTSQLRDAEEGREITSFLEGDPDYQKAVETFVSSLPQKINDMKQAFEKRDLKDLAFKAHALKGLGGFAGFPVFTEKARQLEDTIREEDLDRIHKQIDEMIQLCMRTKLKQ